MCWLVRSLLEEGLEKGETLKNRKICKVENATFSRKNKIIFAGRAGRCYEAYSKKYVRKNKIKFPARQKIFRVHPHKKSKFLLHLHIHDTKHIHSPLKINRHEMIKIREEKVGGWFRNWTSSVQTAKILHLSLHIKALLGAALALLGAPGRSWPFLDAPKALLERSRSLLSAV